MSHTQQFDQKIKEILDATQPGERVCALTGEKWMMTQEEIGWYRIFGVPPSSFAPQTIWLILQGFSTGYEWWWHKHPLTKKPVLSYVHPATGISVLPDAEWFAHDFSSTGKNYVLEQPFFSQLRELQKETPVNATRNAEEVINSLAVL